METKLRILIVNNLVKRNLKCFYYIRRYSTKTEKVKFLLYFFTTLLLTVLENECSYLPEALFYALQENSFSFQLRRFVFYIPSSTSIFQIRTWTFYFVFLVATDIPKLMMCHTCQKNLPSVLRTWYFKFFK